MVEIVQNDLMNFDGHLFTGVHNNALDAKNRFTVPSRWRDALKQEKTLYVMPGIGEGEHCLWVYPKRELQMKIARLRQASMADKRARSVARLFAGSSVDCEWDGQGRIRLTDALLQHAQLKKEICIVGTFERFEIWDPELYQQYREENMDGMDEILGEFL